MTDSQTMFSLKLCSLWNCKSWNSFPIPSLSSCQHPIPLLSHEVMALLWLSLTWVLLVLIISALSSNLSHLTWISQSNKLSLSSALHFPAPISFRCHDLASFKNEIDSWGFCVSASSYKLSCIPMKLEQDEASARFSWLFKKPWFHYLDSLLFLGPQIILSLSLLANDL